MRGSLSHPRDDRSPQTAAGRWQACQWLFKQKDYNLSKVAGRSSELKTC
jgi:hypothetical protein